MALLTYDPISNGGIMPMHSNYTARDTNMRCGPNTLDSRDQIQKAHSMQRMLARRTGHVCAATAHSTVSSKSHYTWKFNIVIITLNNKAPMLAAYMFNESSCDTYAFMVMSLHYT